MSSDLKEETQKLYYSISEVSDLLDINASTIRFWEKEFDILNPAKNKKGNRLFTKKDIDYLTQIIELVKHKGYTIQGAKEQLKISMAAKKVNNVNQEVISKLREIKNKLIDLKNSI